MDFARFATNEQASGSIPDGDTNFKHIAEHGRGDGR